MPFLFDDTIYNNIAFGRKGATQEEIEQTARHANAHDFITQAAAWATMSGSAKRAPSSRAGSGNVLTLARAMLGTPEPF